MNKISYSHIALAVLMALIMYGLSFSQAFDDLKTNVLGVIMLFLLAGAIGYFFTELWYGGEKPDDKKK